MISNGWLDRRTVSCEAEVERRGPSIERGSAGKRRQHESTIRQISNGHECLWLKQAAGRPPFLLFDKRYLLPDAAVGPLLLSYDLRRHLACPLKSGTLECCWNPPGYMFDPRVVQKITKQGARRRIVVTQDIIFIFISIRVIVFFYFLFFLFFLSNGISTLYRLFKAEICFILILRDIKLIRSGGDFLFWNFRIMEQELLH